MADPKVEVVEEEEEKLFDIDEFLAPEDKRTFTTKDYINVAPGFNPVDYFISANYKPINFDETNAVVGNNLGQSFLSGLSMHHAGEKPATYASLDGLSYLVGALIPLVTMNRVSAGTAGSLVGRLGFADDAYMVGKGGKIVPRISGASGVTVGKSKPFNLNSKGPFTMVNDTMQGAPALRKILANKNKLDHGIRIAMEAGLWNLADAELGGLSGYQDALLYTAVGEGLAAGVSRVAGRYKNKNRTKGSDANPKAAKLDDVSKDDYDVSTAAKTAEDTILDEPTIPEGVGPKEIEFAQKQMEKLKNVILKYNQSLDSANKNTDGFIEAIMRLTPKELEGKIFYDAVNKKGHKVLKDGALETVERFEEKLKVAQEVEQFIKPDKTKDLETKARETIEGIKKITDINIEEKIGKLARNFKSKLRRNKKVQELAKEESTFSDKEIAQVAVAGEAVAKKGEQLKLDLGGDEVVLGNPYFDFNPKYISEDVKKIKLTKPRKFKVRTPLGSRIYGPRNQLNINQAASIDRPAIPYIKQFYSAPKASDKPGSYYNFLEQEMRQSSVRVNTRTYETLKDLQEASTILDVSMTRQVERMNSRGVKESYDITIAGGGTRVTKAGETTIEPLPGKSSLRTVSIDLVNGLSTVKKLINKIDNRSAKVIEQAEEQVAKILSKQTKATVLEVSTRGTKFSKQFSALNAKFKDGRSIEEVYQVDIKGYKSIKEGKGKPPKNKKLNLQKEYDKLWSKWIQENPTLVKDLKTLVTKNRANLKDSFAKPGTVNQAETLTRLLKLPKFRNVKPVIETSMEEIPVTVIRSLETAVSLANETVLSRMNPVVARRVLDLKEIIPVRNYNNLVTKLINTLELPKPQPTKTAQQLKLEYLLTGGKKITKIPPSRKMELDVNAEFAEHLKIQQQKIDNFKATFTDNNIIAYLKKNNPKMTDTQLAKAAVELKEQIYTSEYKALRESDRYIKMYEKNYSPDAYYDTTPEVGSDVIKEEADAILARQADEGIDTGEVIDPTVSKEILDSEPDSLARISSFYDDLIKDINDGQMSFDLDDFTVSVTKEPVQRTVLNKPVKGAVRLAGTPLAGRITPMKLSSNAHAAADQLEYMLNVQYNSVPFVSLQEATDYLLPKVKQLVPKARITKEGIQYGKDGLLVIKELSDKQVLSTPGATKYVLLDARTSVTDYIKYLIDRNASKLKKVNPTGTAAQAAGLDVGPAIENISGGKRLKRSTGGKEIDNLDYIETRIGKLLDDTVDAETWTKASNDFKVNNIPLTHNFVNQLADTIQNAIETYKVGNLQSRDLIEIVEVALEKRGINPLKLPRDVDYPNIARRKLDELLIDVEKAGEANKLGVSAYNPTDILEMKKLLKAYAENLDNIVGKDTAEQNALIEEAYQIVKTLKDNGYVNSGMMKLDELNAIADFLKVDSGLIKDSDVELFVKQIEDSFKDEYIKSARAFITKEYGMLNNYIVSDTTQGGTNLEKAMRTQDAAEWRDVVSDYFQNKKTMTTEFGDDFESVMKTIQTNRVQRDFVRTKMLDWITDNSELLENWDVGMGFRPGTELVKNAEGARIGTREVAQLPLMGQQTPGQAGLKFKERLAQIEAGGFKDARSKRLETAGVYKSWWQLMSDNPHVWESFVDRHMLRGQAIDKLYWLNRYANGDNLAKHYILDTIANEPILTNMRVHHLNFMFDYPNPRIKLGDDYVEAGAQEAGSTSPIDEVGRAAGSKDGPAGTNLSPQPADPINIPFIKKHFYGDPAKIFKKAYQVLGDIRFIDLIDTARDYVNRVSVIPKEFSDWMSTSEINKSITAWQEAFPNKKWATEEEHILNTLRDIDYVLENSRSGKNGSRYKLTSIEESMRKRGLTDAEVERALDAQLQIIKYKEEQILTTELANRLSSAESREVARSFYKSIDNIRTTRYNDLLTNDLMHKLEKGAKIAPEDLPKRIGHLVGYFPRIADGNFKVILQKGSRHVNIGTANTANKEAVQKELRRFLKDSNNKQYLENPNDWYIHIVPTGRNLSEITTEEMAKAVDKSYKYALGDVQKYLFGKEKLTAGDNIVDFLARAAKHRGDGVNQLTPYKTLEELLASYWYNTSKAAHVLPLTASIKEIQVNLKKDIQRDLYNYMTDYHNMLIGKKGPTEQTMDSVINNLLDYAYKVPAIAQGLERMGIYQGSGNLRTLSNMIQRTSSFVALGANVATALLQYTIVGLNVLPRLAFDSNSGTILMKAMKHAARINEKTSKYYDAFKKANLEIFKQDGAVQDILNAGGIRKAGPTRQAFRKLNDWAMWLFQDSDTRSRMFTLVVGVENGKNILKKLRGKLKNFDIDSSNYKKYLTQDEQLMWLRGKANNTDMTGKLANKDVKRLIDDYAVDFMEQTNHTYNSFNNPLAFSNPVTKPFLQFKTWVQKEITFFVDAFREVPTYSGVPMAERYGNAAKIVGAFTALGGIFSLPGAQELDMATRWAFGVSPKAWMYEQDSPLQDVLAGGFFTLGGVSMEGRTGPGNLFTVIDTNNLFGIYPARLIKAAAAFREGRTDAALNYALPRFVQNLKQGYDMATTGQLRNTYNGGLTFNVDEMSGSPTLNLIYKLAGFQPMDEARYQTLKFAMLDASKSRGRDRKWVYKDIFDYMDAGEMGKAMALAREADIDFSIIKREYKKKNTPDYMHKTYPYFDKEDEVDKIMGPLFNPKERRSN